MLKFPKRDILQQKNGKTRFRSKHLQFVSKPQQENFKKKAFLFVFKKTPLSIILFPEKDAVF